MRILFICKANFSRSQMAEAFYNKLSNSEDAISAGINPREYEGDKLGSYEGDNTVECMDQIGVDISNKKTKKLTKKMVESVDKIIVMSKKEDSPDFLNTSDKVKYWDVPDPRAMNFEFTEEIRDKIKKKVEQLFNEGMK